MAVTLHIATRTDAVAAAARAPLSKRQQVWQEQQQQKRLCLSVCLSVCVACDPPVCVGKLSRMRLSVLNWIAVLMKLLSKGIGPHQFSTR